MSGNGKTDKAKGRAKEAAGDLTGSGKLKRQGKEDRAAGKTKQKFGDAVDKVRDVARRDA